MLFRVWQIINRAALNIGIQVLCKHGCSMLMTKHLRVGYLDNRGSVYLNL
jgi:hypothetical protein